jgi:hypothetical protein
MARLDANPMLRKEVARNAFVQYNMKSFSRLSANLSRFSSDDGIPLKQIRMK